MADAIYIAGAEPGSGKTVVTIGLARYLKHKVGAMGYLKPIGTGPHGRAACGDDVEIIRRLLRVTDPQEAVCPTTFREVRNSILDGKKEETLEKIRHAFFRVARGKDVVIVEGTDNYEMSSNLELNINADIARTLGCRVLVVVKGGKRSEEDILSEIETVRNFYEEKDASLVGVVINNVPEERYEDLNRGLRERLTLRRIPLIGVIPSSSLLAHPRIRDLIRHADAKMEVLFGEEYLSNVVSGFVIGSMRPHNAIPYFADGSLVVAAGDRDDIVLSVVATHIAEGFPDISGLLLTGGLKPPEVITKIIRGLENFTTPVLSVSLDTYNTIAMLERHPTRIEPDDEEKIREAEWLVRNFVDVGMLIERSHVTVTIKRTPEDFLHFLEEKASAAGKRIVFPEGTEPRVLQAVQEIRSRNIARVVLLGSERDIRKAARRAGTDLADVEIIDPVTDEDNGERYAEILVKKRKHKGMTIKQALDIVKDSIYYGTLMVEAGDADGLVSGAVHSTAHTIRPALQIIKTAPHVKIASSVFFMLKGAKVFLYADCAIVEDPNAEELSDITVASIKTAEAFDITPCVALLSFSTGDSASGPMVEKVKEATRLAREKRPDVAIEGPIQYDAAFDPEVAKVKNPGSKVAGKVNVFIFPDLNSGNIAYKAVQREAGAVALGPILQGLRKPVNDLSRGCTAEDIKYVTAITAVQASFMDRSSGEAEPA